MDGEHRAMARMLPRLVPGERRIAAAYNAAGLLGVALVGAAFVHVLAYHLPIGVSPGPRWGSTTLALLASCPLLGPLGGIAAITILAPLLAAREVLRLERLNQALARRLAARHVALPGQETLPRSRRRLAGFIAGLLVLQTMLVAVAGLVCPMHMTMVMGGAAMTMPVTTALPLIPLHVAVAALLGLLLWRVERRLTRLRAHAVQCLDLLSNAPDAKHLSSPISRSTHLPLGWYGQALFARPPPAIA